MSLLLGCIADDFTGATDLANTLVRNGMRVVQTIGVPPVDGHAATGVDAVDCVVIALKSRTVAPAEAVAQSLAALHWLRERGTVQIYFKVCSTFDSTAEGNIGPVAEALREALGAAMAIVTPAFPENGRTVFKGHLFVGDVPLGESPMRHHPLTPMTDSNLVRVLQAQLTRSRCGLLERAFVARGADAVAARLSALRESGCAFAIADAITDDDLRVLAAATRGDALVVAGSGLALGIPAQHGLVADAAAARLPPAVGTRAVVSGSCSAATNAQVAAFIYGGGAAFAVDPLRLAAGDDIAAAALGWAVPRLSTGRPVLVYATAAAEVLHAVQAELGAARAGALVEKTLARIAAGLVETGVGQLVVAGGETSGACVQALGIGELRIGAQIDPGVPWCHAVSANAGGAGHGSRGLHLALKSGNFGGADFFDRAFAVLDAGT